MGSSRGAGRVVGGPFTLETLAEEVPGEEAVDVETCRYCERRGWREAEGKKSCSCLKNFWERGWGCWKREVVRMLRSIIVLISLEFRKVRKLLKKKGDGGRNNVPRMQK